MEQKIKDIFSNMTILSQPDIDYILNKINLIIMGMKEVEIRVREFNNNYYFYTFLSRGNGDDDRFIYTKYKAADDKEALHILSKYIIDDFVTYKTSMYEESSETDAIKYNIISSMLMYFDDEFREYYRKSKDLKDITEPITDTDFYRNWVLS